MENGNPQSQYPSSVLQQNAASASTRLAAFTARKPLQSSLLWAALVVVALNLAFPFIDPTASVDPAKLPSQHTWEWWRTQAYLSSKPAPDVVVLGSSLVMIPLAVQDADYLNRDLDAVHHPQSVYLQDCLASKLGVKPASCFNFGLPGGMVSDDYMIARALLNGQHKPKVVVLGLTLRDFIENHVPCAAATGTFKYFRHFFSIDELVQLSMPQFWQRFEYGIGKLFSLWGKRLEIQLLSDNQFSSWLRPALDRFSSKIMKNPLAPAEARDNLAQKLKTVAEEGDFVLKAHQVYPYEDNSNEYKKRLKDKNSQLFATESVFLDKLLALLKQQGTEVLIVNMPLTERNMQLMPSGSYSEYMTVVSRASQKFSVPLVDLNDGKSFELSDFRDTAHMNARGGKKLIDLLVEAISGDRTICSALTRGGSQVESQHSPEATRTASSVKARINQL